MKVECELDYRPATGTTQRRFKLHVDGRSVFEGYESELTPGERAVVQKILKAHSEAVAVAANAISTK